MTWTRALKNLVRHPLYLVMTLLPTLLSCLLMFPLLERLGGFILQVIEVGRSASFFEHGAGSLTSFDWFTNLIPLLLLFLGFWLVEVAVSLVITPVSLQYLGEGARFGRVPDGYAGRGLRRLWWKPFVFGLLASTATAPLQMSTSADSELGVAGAVLALIVALISVAVSILISMATSMFYASAAMEDLPFFTAIGRSIKRTFRRFGRLFGAAAAATGVTAVPGLILGAVLTARTLIDAAHVADVEEALSMFPELFSTVALLATVTAVFSWAYQCFITAYAMELTKEMTDTPAPQTAPAPVFAAPAAPAYTVNTLPDAVPFVVPTEAPVMPTEAPIPAVPAEPAAPEEELPCAVPTAAPDAPAEPDFAEESAPAFSEAPDLIDDDPPAPKMPE